MKIFEAIYNEACAVRLEEATVKQVADAIAKFTKCSIDLGRVDDEALKSLERLLQNTMMSEVGIDGDKSHKGVNNAINYVIHHSTNEWSGGNPGEVRDFLMRFKDQLGPYLGKAVDLGISADNIKVKSEIDAARGVGTVLNNAQALNIAKKQM